MPTRGTGTGKQLLSMSFGVNGVATASQITGLNIFPLLMEGYDDKGGALYGIAHEFWDLQDRVFEGEGRPLGPEWSELSHPYAEIKKEKYGDVGILVARGNLRDSLTIPEAGGSEQVFRVDKNSMEIGTAVEYAHYHVTGTRTPMDRRNFMPVITYAKSDFKDKIEDVMASWQFDMARAMTIKSGGRPG
jgi:phage gpG-like protein